MTSTAAQDEFDALFRDKGRRANHPEDDIDNDNPGSSDEASSSEPTVFYEKDSDSDEIVPGSSSMRSRYFLPKQRFQSNTGPKGVIADAQAFEQAKKAKRFSFSAARNVPAAIYSRYSARDGGERSSDEDDEDGFLQRWRQSRLRELQQSEIKAGSGSRGASPGRRTFGSLVTVDGEGYLDAIEKVSPNTVVVVYIYDESSEVSILIENCLRQLARTHPTTRFVKLHYEDAEMEVAGVPALLAYRGGDKFAGLVPIVDEIPDDAEPSTTTLQAVLSRYNIL
ncbi:thioredoxin-like protein [Aulographum hederae CBS 113979]|uniref:Thioredoxin-like protein n=1 Tax=Aulographum hederae CBS 113979 TaxID=1176131 RepID=A0A6G1HAD5_9PEZI|nr:thioredoxin-like protein [Aulographum hederae CBS 113979]